MVAHHDPSGVSDPGDLLFPNSPGALRVIEARGLTKRYGATLAVDDLTFTVRPGVVTGFLGPNGAGKSTTMRMMLGLDRPTGGSVQVNSDGPHAHAAPLARGRSAPRGEVGAPRSLGSQPLYGHWQPPRGIRRARVDQVLELVGLTGVADTRVGSFSLGMGQRLGVASALLGDPATLVLDEPINGLDLDGVRWIRSLLKGLAAEGRTVFLSSHLMGEMAVTADHVIVIGKGRLLRDQPMAEFIDQAAVETVRVRASEVGRLAGLVKQAGASVALGRSGAHRRGALQRPHRDLGGPGADHGLRAGARVCVPGGRLSGTDPSQCRLPRRRP